jgi:type VI secretion system protein ImpA
VTDFDRFLTPLEGESPCGPDLEYDNEFLALTLAVAGKPEQQFGDTVIPAGEPDWREIESLAGGLMTRTRDLRVVASYTLANTYLHGVTDFSAGLKLALGLCEQFWESVHPRIEVDGENDPYLRMNALAEFSVAEFSAENRLIQALRQCSLVKQPMALSFRDAELAFNKAPEATYSLEQISSTLTDALAEGNKDIAAVADAYSSYKALRALLDERVSVAEAPDMDRLDGVLKPVAQGLERLRSSAAAETDAESESVEEDGTVIVRGPGGSGVVQNREDARRALDRVCEYLERNEPSNPASLFARRAQRLLSMPFLDIMRELSPDSMSHLEMLTGAPPQQQD